MMTTLYHPTFPDVTVEVPDGPGVKDHQDAGWRKTPLTKSDPPKGDGES